MATGPEYTEVDQHFYDTYLADFLPGRLFDVHVHVFRQRDVPFPSEDAMRTNWASSVSAEEFTAEDIETDYAKLFPHSETRRLQFGAVRREADIEAENRYCMETADHKRVWALAVLDPLWTPEKLREVLLAGRFMGVKPYWSLVRGKKEEDVRIEEMMPPEHLEILDELGLIAILHVPGPERIRDTHTRKMLRDWCRKYTNVTFIVAHLGRAYCMPFAAASFEDIASIEGLMFDCCAVLNPDVFELAFRAFGPDRIMWGTDFPVLNRLRGYRVWEGEKYRNIVSGDYPWNTNRQPPEVEARYTYFIYTALKAMREGAERAGLTSSDLQDIFFNNAYKLITRRNSHVQ